MTTMHWWRCMHGAPFDPKWRVVALQAKTEPGKVWAVVSALYDRASQSSNRGDVAGAGLDEIAEGFGWPVEDIQRIYSALKAKAVIIDNRIASWEKHQPKRERPADSSAERTRRYRERLKMASHGVTSVTPSQPKSTVTGDVTVTVRDGHVTPVTVVTETAPSQPPAQPQQQAKNGHACDATVTPGDAQRRGDSFFLLSSSTENIGSKERGGVASDQPPPSFGKKPSKKKTNGIEPGIPTDDVGAIVDYWNGLAEHVGLPQVRMVTATRRQKVQARINELGGVVNLGNVIDKIEHQPFLLGKNKRNWHATFDWVMEPGNLAKVAENTYANTGGFNGHA